jgi:hypothetical protein
VVDWGVAKVQAQSIISANGEQFQLLQRTLDYTDSFSTGSSVTYGYGDPTVTITTGSLTAIVEPVKEADVQLETGFYLEDYRRIYVNPDTTLVQRDMLIYPSGSGTKYVIQPEKYWDADGYSIVHTYIIRKLVPRSGSAF